MDVKSYTSGLLKITKSKNERTNHLFDSLHNRPNHVDVYTLLFWPGFIL